MTAVLDLLNYGFVLLYGTFLTVGFAGGCSSKKERRMVAVVGAIILIAQVISYSLWGFEQTKKLYPLICHLPLFLMLVLLFKRTWGVALVSVLTAYFCCQLPRWIGTLTLFLFGTSLAYQLGYMISIVPGNDLLAALSLSIWRPSVILLPV